MIAAIRLYVHSAIACHDLKVKFEREECSVLAHFGSSGIMRIIRKQKFPSTIVMGVQWLSGRVLDSRLSGRGFEPHRRHCIVVLEQDTFILA